MSNWSFRQQQQHQPSVQSYPWLNNHRTIVSITLAKNDSQQFRETNVTVNLSDCMKCFIRVPRCEIEINKNQYDSNTYSSTAAFDPELQELLHEIQVDLYSTDTEIKLDVRTQELHKEGQLQKQQDQTLSQEEVEEEIYGEEGVDIEDSNPMDSFIELPWPPSQWY